MNVPVLNIGGQDYNMKDTEARDQIANLKIDLDVNKLSNEAILPASLYTIENTIIKADGTGIQTMNNFASTPLIEIFSNDLYFIGGFFPLEAYNTFVLYDASMNVLFMGRGDNYIQLADYPTAKYFRASKSMVDDNVYVKIGHTHGYDYVSELNRYFTSPEPMRLSNKYYTIPNVILSGDGTTVTSFEGWSTTDFIDIFSSDIIFNGNYFPAGAYNSFVLYDGNKHVVAMFHENKPVIISDYPTAKYFRASMYPADPTGTTYIEIMNRAGYIPREINIGDGMEYETIKEGLAEAIKYPNAKVIVHPGVYDLAEEFEDEIQAETARGVELGNNVYVKFMAGAYVKALFPVSSTYISTYFQPFYGHNFTLDGLNIEASNCRYCVHDEQASADYTYHNKYINCIMKMTAHASSGGTFGGVACIGAGFGKHGYVEITGGVYESVGDSQNAHAILFHNGGSNGCDNRLFIDNVYLADNNYISIISWGTQDKVSQIMISNCSFGLPIEEGTVDQGGQDNMNVIEWNNTVRNN